MQDLDSMVEDSIAEMMDEAEGVPLPAAYNAGAPRQKIAYQYDWQGRRVSKVVSNKVGGVWQLESRRLYLYDGWNLVAELSQRNVLERTHVWGLDLSGTMQGAGGVGGLLETAIHTGTNAGTYFAMYDGNGNVVGYVRAGDGAVVAQYEYGPFGELLRATCPLAREFNFLFSTKYFDWETGLYYYGHRYYNPTTGRWLSRDPIVEGGGLNLYGFVRNNPVNYYDHLGLKAKKCKEITTKDGTPFIFFDPPASEGGGWKISRFDFISGGGSTLTLMDGFSVGWSAKVEVYCRCDDGYFEARKRTRIHSKTFDGPHDWFVVYEAGAMPICIPTPTTFLEAIGEAVATVVDSNLPKPISIATSTANEIAEKIAANRPTKPTEDKWKDKSPCEK